MIRRGVHVSDLRKAVDDPVTSPKILVLRGQRTFEDEDSAVAVDSVLRRLKSLLPTIEVNDLALPSYRIIPNVSNDPDDSMFAPEDQFPLVIEAVRKADVIIVASAERSGFPSADIVRLLERMSDMAKAKLEDGKLTQAFLSNILCAVVVNGGPGARAAALATAAAFNDYGCMLVKSGIAHWCKEPGGLDNDKEFGVTLEQIASDIATTLRRLR